MVSNIIETYTKRLTLNRITYSNNLNMSDLVVRVKFKYEQIVDSILSQNPNAESYQ